LKTPVSDLKPWRWESKLTLEMIYKKKPTILIENGKPDEIHSVLGTQTGVADIPLPNWAHIPNNTALLVANYNVSKQPGEYPFVSSWSYLLLFHPLINS
jgi:hypothetical protein